MEYALVTSATAQGFTRKSLEIPRAKTTSDVRSATQMLEDLLRKYEEDRDKKYDNDLELQRLHDVLPKPIEQQLVGARGRRRVSDIRVSETKSKQMDNDEFDGASTHGLGDEMEETMMTTVEDKIGTRHET